MKINPIQHEIICKQQGEIAQLTKERDEAQAKLREAEAKCVELREALELWDTERTSQTWFKARQHALSSDCGKNFIDAHSLKNAVCSHCGHPATCIGRYEDPNGPLEFGCDTCCGHGNEDGFCVRIGCGKGYVRVEESASTKCVCCGNEPPTRCEKCTLKFAAETVKRELGKPSP